LVEDETYFWSLSRYIHLNPVRGKRPLVSHPREWRWSSYPGYGSRRARFDWVAYDFVYAAWQGHEGGRDPENAYRRHVERGLTEPPENPFRYAIHGWLLGSLAFVDKIRARAGQAESHEGVPAARRLRPLISAGFIPQCLRTTGSIRSLSETFVPSPSAETLPHGCHAN
jgi:putative transposase